MKRGVRPTAVIPARFASSRFPGKPLALLAGRPLVQHVWQRCVDSGAFAQVLVATDDARIARAARDFGAEVALTREDCASGTDRVAEVAAAHPEVLHWVNVQGDEPLIAHASLRALAELIVQPQVELATLVRPLAEEERASPHVVKAVVTGNDEALYFSRADLPFQREGGATPQRWAHVGLYGYRRDVLLRVAALPPSPLEQVELLEQLRALEAGVRIRVARVASGSPGVDTPEDLARARDLLATESGQR